MKELIRQKQAGKPIELPERREPARVVNLMEALRRSVEAEKRPPAKQAVVRHSESKKGKRAGARHKKAS